MENFKEWKKIDLIAKCEENVHLASAVNAKDAEMVQLKKEHQTVYNELKQNVDKSIKEAVDRATKEKDQNIVNLQKLLEQRDKLLKHYASKLDNLVAVHGALLKSLQGTLDIAIEHNQFFVENINGGK